MDSHVLITGTGRAGTSLLMQILTELGLDTGFPKGYKLDPRSRAGMEVHYKNINHWHYIVKNPEFCYEIKQILSVKPIDHVFILMRDPWEVVLSREENEKQKLCGGYWYAHNKQEQAEINDLAIHTLMHDIASYDLPHTLIHFDLLVSDPEYLWAKLMPLLFDFEEIEEEELIQYGPRVEYEDFLEVYNSLVDTSKIKFK